MTHTRVCVCVCVCKLDEVSKKFNTDVWCVCVCVCVFKITYKFGLAQVSDITKYY